jgi:hypothetical protein
VTGVTSCILVYTAGGWEQLRLLQGTAMDTREKWNIYSPGSQARLLESEGWVERSKTEIGTKDVI